MKVFKFNFLMPALFFVVLLSAPMALAIVSEVVNFYPTSGSWNVREVENNSGDLSLGAFDGLGAWGNSTYDNVFTGDIDGDGYDELLVYKSSTGDWYSKKITGTQNNWDLGAYDNLGRYGDSSYEHLCAGDINGDGIDEMIVFNSAAGAWYAIEISNNAGDLSLNTSTGFHYLGAWGNSAYNNIAAGDINGDGYDDIIVFNDSEGKWYTRKQTGDWALGTFDRLTEGTVTWGTTEYKDISSGDLNNDGIDEVIVFRVGNGVGEWYSRQISNDNGDLSLGTYDKLGNWGYETSVGFVGDFVPEPATVMLLSLGGILAVRRRR